jgi:tetratricopeptide (TPR) repeat protein
MTLSLEKGLDFDHEVFEKSLNDAYKTLLKSFKRICQTHLLFHLFFITFTIFELIGFFYFFFLFQQTYLALSIAALFFTGFAYTSFYFYLQTKKPEQFSLIKDRFITATQKAISVSVPEGDMSYHLGVAQASIRIALYLKDFDKTFYRPSIWSENRGMQKLGTFFYLQDICLLKQILLGAAIQEHNQQIRIYPTDMEVHTSLANTYSILSKHFMEAKKKIERSLTLQIRFRKMFKSLDEKFRESAKRAVEEFTILQYYTPEDPWVHQMLARTYQDLDMPEKEIEEYEKMAAFSTLDPLCLFRLGVLYFQQGDNGKGLSIYEKLKEKNKEKAEELISFYGCFKNQIFTFDQDL